MAYCPHCGKETEKNEKFCRNCGKEIKSDGLQQKPEPGRGSVNVSVVITGMICVTVIIVVIVVAFIFTSRGSKQPEASQEELSSSAAETEQENSSGSSGTSGTEQKESAAPSAAPGTEQEEPSAQSGTPGTEQKESSAQSGTSGKGQEEPSAQSGTSEAGQGSQGNANPGAEEDIPLKEWPELDTLPFSTQGFQMELPGTWAEHYSLEKGDDFYAFYNVENAGAGYGGFLFSIEIYKQDGEWEYLPSYQFLGEKDGAYYVATFPTDVQFDIENQENQQIYKEMQEDIEGILATFALK